MFINTDKGEIALDRIVRITGEQGGARRTVWYKFGREEPVSSAVAQHLDSQLPRRILHMVPAQPGTYALVGVAKAGKWVTRKSPVVAWAATADGLVHAVTAEGVFNPPNSAATILHPDGSVESPYDPFACLYDGEVDWAAHMLEESDAAEVRRAAAGDAYLTALFPHPPTCLVVERRTTITGWPEYRVILTDEERKTLFVADNVAGAMLEARAIGERMGVSVADLSEDIF